MSTKSDLCIEIVAAKLYCVTLYQVIIPDHKNKIR